MTSVCRAARPTHKSRESYSQSVDNWTKKNQDFSRFVLSVWYNAHMIKTHYINCGKDIHVFITGDSHEEAEQAFWSLYNHKATNQPDPDWRDEFTVSFWTQEARLIRAFRKAAVNAILNNHSHKFEGKRGALIPALADKLAARRWRQCKTMPYLKTPSVANLDCYAMGTISAERPDSDYGNRESA